MQSALNYPIKYDNINEKPWQYNHQGFSPMLLITRSVKDQLHAHVGIFPTAQNYGLFL